MPSLKDLRVRITSVKSTQKITSAMKMVAAAKLKRAQVAAEQGRPYAESMERMLGGLLAGLPSPENAPKLLAGHGSEQKHLLVIVTSDRGLAGGFNANIAREARRKIAALQREGKEVKLLLIGRKGRDALRRDYGRLIMDTLENVTRNGAEFDPVRELSRKLQTMFDDGEFDVCTLLFNTFKSAISQVVTSKQVIPLPAEEIAVGEMAAAAPQGGVYEMEPDDEALLNDLLPANLSMQLFRALLESYASEQGARMTAMDNATRNAGDMIARLTLVYNRSRQAAITKELIEIISGAEAV
ncbi:MAG: F0F1 ATP synthase subunit gamma [Rhodospirillales bacterium]|nr:F0F1 ATP synthase subunit gamma [Rhodospirillales bacterium]